MEYGLGVVMGAVDKKKLGEYAGSVLMQTSLGGGRIRLSATDMEVFATVTLGCVGIAIAGEIVLPAEKFQSAIKSCGSGEVIISSDDINALIEGTSAEYQINGLDPLAFPAADIDENQDRKFDVPPGVLASCINAVNHAACRDLQKPNINGINFAMSETGALTVAATDGHRLSLATVEIAVENIRDTTAHRFTLPPKGADLLAKITATMNVGRVAKQCRLYFGSGSISICINEGTGEYPDVRRIIPTGPGEVITVDTDALITALESCCIMSDDQYRSVNLDIAEEKLTVSAIGTNNTAKAVVPCLCDCAIKIRMNSRYLIQALKSLDSTEVFIKYFGQSSPLMLMPADYKQWNERIEIIMPLGAES